MTEPAEISQISQPMWDAMNVLNARLAALSAYAGPTLAAPLVEALTGIGDAYVTVLQQWTAEGEELIGQRDALEVVRNEDAATLTVLAEALRVIRDQYGSGPDDPYWVYVGDTLAWFEQGAQGPAPASPAGM